MDDPQSFKDLIAKTTKALGLEPDGVDLEICRDFYNLGRRDENEESIKIADEISLRGYLDKVPQPGAMSVAVLLRKRFEAFLAGYALGRKDASPDTNLSHEKGRT